MLSRLFKSTPPKPLSSTASSFDPKRKLDAIGLIAGNGTFPIAFAREAKKAGCLVYAVCHEGETDKALVPEVESATWIRVGQLGALISFFRESGVRQVAMAGGISRVKHFGDVKLDLRGAALIARLRSTKDDVIMRGIADELVREGIEVVSSTIFLAEQLIEKGILSRSRPNEEEERDIEVGKSAIAAMSSQDIGQLVVVREGVVVAVEASEGSDACIRRGGELGGAGTVVVKFAKPTQDMRFDVPTVGKRTILTLIEAKARVLALEAGRCLFMEREESIELADKHKIAIIGCEPLDTKT